METIEDIVREMRGEYDHSGMVCFGEDGQVILDGLADRLDAAYKRDLQSMVDASEIDMRTAMDEVERLREENARLNAALKPIIEFRPEIRGNYGEWEAWDPDEMMEAMVESREIYNGGAK